MAIVNNAGGTTATTGSAATKFIAADKTKQIRGLNIINEGAFPGWLSFDGGTTKHLRIPAGPWQRSINASLLLGPFSLANGIFLIPDSTDMTAVYIELFT